MNIDQGIAKAIELLSGSRKAVALTGAGISTPSGIPDFRSPRSGLWEKVDPFEVASIHSFKRRPEAFYHWLRPLARKAVDAQANSAHIALAQLEESGPLSGIITQNIDNLHYKAGSQQVYELHGHMREMTCLSCYSIFPSDVFIDNFITLGKLPICQRCQGMLKPNLILIGEQLPMDVVNQAMRLVYSCDVMIVVGSSLTMSPAGDIPFQAHAAGAKVIIVNYEPTPADYLAEVVIHANVVDVIPKLAAPFVKQ